MKKIIGVVGLGNIGMGIANNLVKKGFEVHAFDLNKDLLSEFGKTGGKTASSLKDLAQKCTLIFSVLVNYSQNLSVFAGSDALLEHMQKGSTIFICSTITSGQAQYLGQLSAEKGINCLDAPVSGGRVGADAGKLALMIGGDEKVFNDCLEVLEGFAVNINRFGDIGAGEAAKAINQILVAVNIVSTGEAMVLASKCKLDLKKIYEMVTHSGGNSNMFKERAMYMIDRDFTTRGALDLMLKDTNIVMESVKALGLVLPLTSLSNQIFQAGSSNGWGQEDCAAVVKTIEQLSNHEINQEK